jgi:putative membrane-bound dehydrogenase-like protein
MPAFRLFPAACALCAMIAAAVPTRAAEPIPHGQSKPPGPPLSPEEAVRKMTVPEGFSVEIVACEPDLVNPVAMTFDEKGRVWVTESLEYPRSSPGEGRDRVKVMEDTDGDGRMDRFTIFADGLNIPSGIAVGYGGVWVANAPDILFLKDTDGDLKADTREVVVTGFGRHDTHELPNSLTWGPDGYLYGLNGVFNHSHVRYPAGSPHAKKNPDGFQFTVAMFRIDPRTREFEVFAEGTSNPWGIAFDPLGSAFVSACVIDHLWHITETGYYHRQAGAYPPFTWKIESIVDHKHQKAAYCGLHYFDSDAYPKEYRDTLYMGNIHGNCINADVLERRGSTYHAKPRPDFLSANDAWFMPVVQKTGPDGCLYVLDWYDRYHCYQDARRDPAGIDRLKGRLYRIRYKNTPRAEPFDLTKESDADLIERLSSPNVYFRDVAQRLLTERLTDESDRGDAETRRKIEAIVLDENTPRKARLHALYALVGTKDLAPEFHVRLLEYTDPSLRAWAIRAVGNMPKLDARVLDWIQTHPVGVATPVDVQVAPGAAVSPDVLLQVAITSTKVDRDRAVGVLMAAAAACGDDPLVPRIVWQNMHPLLGEPSPAGGTNADMFLQMAAQKPFVDSPNILALMPRVADRILAADQPDPDTVAMLFLFVTHGETGNAQVAGRCLDVLAERIQTGELSEDETAALRKRLGSQLQDLIEDGDQAPLALAASLVAASWGDAAAVETVRRTALDTGAEDEPRLRALSALVATQDASVTDVAAAILGDAKRNDMQLREQTLARLGRLQSDEVAEIVLAAYPRMEPELQPKAVELLTQRAGWAKDLLGAIGDDQLPASVINANQARRLLAIGDEDLTAAVKRHWGDVRETRDPAREKFIAEMRSQLLKSKGDAVAGRAVFNKVCGQCHKIYGEGQEVGPDITRNGRGSFEQILSNVFDPSLVIGADYRAVTVATTDGRVVTGLVVEDSPQRVVLKVQGGKQEIIAREDVAAQRISEVSLMPEGLEKQIKPQEMADLFEFLMLDRPPEDPKAQRLPTSTTIEGN